MEEVRGVEGRRCGVEEGEGGVGDRRLGNAQGQRAAGDGGRPKRCR